MALIEKRCRKGKAGKRRQSKVGGKRELRRRATEGEKGKGRRGKGKGRSERGEGKCEKGKGRRCRRERAG
jgi:hypothetical protein